MNPLSIPIQLTKGGGSEITLKSPIFSDDKRLYSCSYTQSPAFHWEKKKNPSQYNQVSHRSLNYPLHVRKCLEKKMSFSRKSLSLESDAATLGSLEGTDIYFMAHSQLRNI